MITIHIEDETGMLKLGGELAHQLDGEGSVLIKGDLGAGKTTLCRGLIHAMGHEGAVKSPTFTLVEPYRIGKRDIFHFDLYRLSHPDELEYIGIDEYFGENRLCLVEWPEKAAGHLPHHDLEIAIDVCGEKRNISIQANSRDGESICDSLSKTYDQT
ncbi:MAG: tRNA (adenosine(37)-N6)-threonylcarbamoyltransferase complex ATPase subunit type 1 TsaE [Gammaproteobacteria bacterium]|jgi:tRNA threonylcarbamoyladenosine biosynthesis protein TsaE|nr:tRNA (adenosine(37)-N6)-threonylcarbamoyltransferase complex ATPase subunit type 1 TsaE [Gammaproteobacteria bacterium]